MIILLVQVLVLKRIGSALIGGGSMAIFSFILSSCLLLPFQADEHYVILAWICDWAGDRICFMIL
jgi:hypothetical protein